jgi:hypothetical protein
VNNDQLKLFKDIICVPKNKRNIIIKLVIMIPNVHNLSSRINIERDSNSSRGGTY